MKAPHAETPGAASLDARRSPSAFDAHIPDRLRQVTVLAEFHRVGPREPFRSGLWRRVFTRCGAVAGVASAAAWPLGAEPLEIGALVFPMSFTTTFAISLLIWLRSLRRRFQLLGSDLPDRDADVAMDACGRLNCRDVSKVVEPSPATVEVAARLRKAVKATEGPVSKTLEDVYERWLQVMWLSGKLEEMRSALQLTAEHAQRLVDSTGSRETLAAIIEHTRSEQDKVSAQLAAIEAAAPELVRLVDAVEAAAGISSDVNWTRACSAVGGESSSLETAASAETERMLATISTIVHPLNGHLRPDAAGDDTALMPAHSTMPKVTR